METMTSSSANELAIANISFEVEMGKNQSDCGHRNEADHVYEVE